MPEVETLEFAGGRPAVVRESEVRAGLTLRQAIP